MISPKYLLETFYYDSQSLPGRAERRTRNHPMQGIIVKHRGKTANVYFYINGDGFSNLGPKFKNRVQRIIEKKELDADLLHCDFAATYTDENAHYKMVEWTTSLRLRKIMLRYGNIQRALRITITHQTETRFEFHVVLELH